MSQRPTSRPLSLSPPTSHTIKTCPTMPSSSASSSASASPTLAPRHISLPSSSPSTSSASSSPPNSSSSSLPSTSPPTPTPPYIPHPLKLHPSSHHHHHQYHHQSSHFPEAIPEDHVPDFQFHASPLADEADPWDVKAKLTDMLNCAQVRGDPRMRLWVQERLMVAELEMKRQRRRRVGLPMPALVVESIV